MDPDQNNQPQVPTPPDPAQQYNSAAAPTQPSQQAAAPVPATEPTAMPPVINSTAPQPTPQEVPQPQTIQPIDQFTTQQQSPVLPQSEIGSTPPQPAAVPLPQAQASVPVIQPQQPMPTQQPSGYPVPTPGKKFPIKLVSIIAGSIIAIAILAVGGLFAYNTLFSSIALKTFQGDGYSVLVPEDYEQEGSGNDITFTEPDSPEDERSIEGISIIDVKSLVDAGVSRQDMIDEFDKIFTKDSLSESSSGINGNSKFDEFDIEKTTFNGEEARKITSTLVNDGERTGSMQMMIVYSKDAFYMVAVVAHNSDPGLERASGKILSSLKIE